MKKRCARRSRNRRKRRNKVPRATVSMETQHVDLKTCPPDGFVELRRMTFGELMTSQDMAYQVQMKAGEDADNPEMGVTMSRIAIMEYQFQKCVMRHNLEDDKGRVLDFRKAPDVHLLDANIGQEISGAIDDMHNWQKQYPNSDASSLNGSSAGSGPVGVAPKTSDQPPSELPTKSSV